MEAAVIVYVLLHIHTVMLTDYFVECHYAAECRFEKCHYVLCHSVVIMLSVILQGVVMITIIIENFMMLNAIMKNSNKNVKFCKVMLS